jgi:Mycothiol maleylpyruvate isomerase N-terminal domain
VSELDLLMVTASDGRDLLASAQSDWSRPVLDCPGWNTADLVGHTGAILGWIAKIVTSGRAVPRRDRETPPADHDALAICGRSQA